MITAIYIPQMDGLVENFNRTQKATGIGMRLVLLLGGLEAAQMPS